MCKVKNRGSATIELCLIMPLILLVIVMLVRLYMGLIYEGNICGKSYNSLYVYELSGSSVSLEELNIKLDEISNLALVNEEDRCKLSASMTDGNLSIHSVSAALEVTYKTEYDRCSSRLRRWQMYGDVVQ